MSEPTISKIERKYVRKAIRSGWVSSNGQYVERIEEELNSYLKTDYATCVSNGTVALHLALLALNISAGDEVIIPNLSFIAVANSVIYVGADVVLCDVEQNSLGLDPEKLIKLISLKTKAVIVVHNYGFMSQIEEIRKICDEANIFLIEDCAEALFLEYQGRKVGTFGDISTYSFYGNKVVTSGEGGAVASSSKELIERVKFLKNQGIDPSTKFEFKEIGYNYRLTNLQAALLCGQLENLQILLAKRYKVFSCYKDGLEECKGITPLVTKNLSDMSPWLFSIQVDEDEYGTSASELRIELSKVGIDSRPFFYPLSKTRRFDQYRRGNLSVSEELYKNCISLPTFAHMKRKQIKQVISAISDIHESNRPYFRANDSHV